MEKFTSPRSECMYAFLQVPNTTFDDKGVYQITLLLDPKNEDHHELMTHLKNLHAESKGKDDRKPYKKHIDEAGNETGLFQVKFKSHYPVATFDSLGQKIKRDQNFVANGSVVRVSWAYGFYDKAGSKGVSLYLQGVQILMLIEWKGGAAEDYGFEPEEGYNEFEISPADKEELEQSLQEDPPEKIEEESDLPF